MKKLIFLVTAFIILAPSIALAAGEAAEVGRMFQECINSGGRAAATYNAWVAQNGCICPGSSTGSGQRTCSGASSGSLPAGPTPLQQLQLQGAQQLGTAIGNQIGQALFGSPQDQAAQQAQQQAQQQRTLAAQQLNNSGIYLLKHGNYAGALNEFQQALAQTPDDPNIINNIALAKQQISDKALAAKNSAALEKLLGKAPAKSGTLNFDQFTQSSPPPGPNSSSLNLVNLSSDANAVDLRGTKNTSVDAAALKTKLDSILGNHASVPAPPNPRLQLPEDKDMELLGQPSQSTRAQSMGMQRPYNAPKLVNPIQSEKQIKAETGRQFDAIFAQPGGLDDILEKQATGANSK